MGKKYEELPSLLHKTENRDGGGFYFRVERIFELLWFAGLDLYEGVSQVHG